MTTRERQAAAIKAAARTATAVTHLAAALREMTDLSRDIGIQHAAVDLIKVALRDAESADAVMRQLLATLHRIEEPPHASPKAPNLALPRKR